MVLTVLSFKTGTKLIPRQSCPGELKSQQRVPPLVLTSTFQTRFGGYFDFVYKTCVLLTIKEAFHRFGIHRICIVPFFALSNEWHPGTHQGDVDEKVALAGMFLLLVRNYLDFMRRCTTHLRRRADLHRGSSLCKGRLSLSCSQAGL